MCFERIARHMCIQKRLITTCAIKGLFMTDRSSTWIASLISRGIKVVIIAKTTLHLGFHSNRRCLWLLDLSKFHTLRISERWCERDSLDTHKWVFRCHTLHLFHLLEAFIEIRLLTLSKATALRPSAIYTTICFGLINI